jgi:kumamolisin
MALRKKTGVSSKSRATKRGSAGGRKTAKRTAKKTAKRTAKKTSRAAKAKSARKTSTKKAAKKSPVKTRSANKKSARQKTSASRTHVAVPGSSRPPTKGSIRLRAADPQSHVEVTLTLRGPELPDANHLPAQALSSQDFQARYSASQSDADKVSTVLQHFGLKIEHVSLETRSIRVGGSVAMMEAAFHPNLGIYENADQGEFRDRESDYTIPAELKDIVTAVVGFGQRQVARRNASGAAAHAASGQTPLTPADLETHYSFPHGNAAGQKIAIAEFGGGYFASDVEAFCAKYNRPVPTIHAVSINAPAYTLAQILKLPKAQRNDALDSSGEVMMDVQIIAGLCPGAVISVYFATFDQKGWVDLLNRAIIDRPVALSVSWGLAEDSSDWSKAALDAINERLNAAATLGITVCVAAGDDGSGDEATDARAHVDFPSSSPFVLGVGGTMMTQQAEHVVEQAWWQSPGRRTPSGGGATGGGISVRFPRPQWQTVKVSSVNRNSIDGRVVPDIAALAGPPWYDLIFRGDDAPNGGTSASAPLWASLIARGNGLLPAHKQQRYLTPLLYGKVSNGQTLGQAICHDVTVGHNTSNPKPGVGYKAAKGFDAVSGWGTPIGTSLLSAL